MNPTLMGQFRTLLHLRERYEHLGYELRLGASKFALHKGVEQVKSFVNIEEAEAFLQGYLFCLEVKFNDRI